MSEPIARALHAPHNALVPWWYLIAAYAIILGCILVLYPVVSPVVVIGGLIVLFVTVYYPEIPLVAFVFIGVTKPWMDENIAIFQVIDYTVFLAVYLFVLIFITMVRRETYTLPSFFHFLPIIFVISILLFIGIIYSPTPIYGFEKASRYFSFTILLFISTIVYMKERRDIMRILAFIVILSFIFATVMLYEALQYFLAGDVAHMILRMTILGANPIASARIFSLAFLILLVAAYYTTRKRDKLIFYLLSGYFLIALIITNTRGPLVSTLAAVIVFAIFFSEMKLKTVALYIGLFICMLVSAFLILPDFVTSRYEVLIDIGEAQQALGGAEIDTVGSRILMWSMALSGGFNSLWNFLFGHGTGSFASLFHFGDFRWYPHNLFAELFFELGIIGVTVFILHLLHVSSYAKRIWNKYTSKNLDKMLVSIVFTATIVTLFAAMVSGDINDNRLIWFFFGLIITYWRIFTAENTYNKNAGVKHSNIV